MKHRLLPLAICLPFIVAIPLSAQAQLAHEFTQLQDQHTKAVAAAVEPVNRRYQAALESMLRRATQTNDLQTANKISEELKKLGVTSQTVAEPSGVTIDSLTKRLIGTKWLWFGNETITFLEGGKAQWKDSPVQWPWKVTSAARRIVEGENMNKGKKWTITFERDLMTGTVEGEDGSRKIQRASR